jgi:penicillin-binding protein 2
MLQALYNGTPPLEAYPAGDRERIKEQQKRLEGDRRPKARPSEKDRA